MYDLIIIGGGPAGVTAGIYASRKKLKTLLITKDFFGQISKTGQVDNWPGDMAISGMALALKLEKHLKSFPIEIKSGQKVVAVDSVILSQHSRHSEPAGEESDGTSCRPEAPAEGSLIDPSLITQGDRGSIQGDRGSIQGDKKSIQNDNGSAFFTVQVENGEVFEAKALIIATGGNAKTLGIEGEQDFMGKGLSYCSICDAPFFRDKQVAVIGGGNAGFETALDLIKYAKKVFIFEKFQKILADEALVEKVRQTGGIEVCLQAEILKIEGLNKVQSIVYKDLALGKTMQQPMDGIFVQIGSVPATGFLGKLVEFDEKNEVKVNPQTFETSVRGIFAAGDCNDTKWKQAIIAAGQGATAALSAYEYLNRRVSP